MSQNKTAQETLGKLLEGEYERDAIHVAVLPVVAGMTLDPGEHIGLDTDGRAIRSDGIKPIGIVDPYLIKRVYAGEQFWLCLYPRTVTTIRHEWSHPDVPDNSIPKWASMSWMKMYASSISESYDDLMAAATAYILEDEYYSKGGKFEGRSVPDSFWDHYEKIQGVKIDEDKRGNFFSCSC